MKVLITGSTAQQCNPLTHERSPNFTGLLVSELTRLGADVDWRDPSISPTVESLAKYDKVIVGLSSPLALGSNRIYGALTTIEALLDDPRLMLLIDGPDPNNITRGIKGVINSPNRLTKEFFAPRAGFEKMADPLVRVKAYRALDHLTTQEWPTTLVPAFPWMVEAQVEEELPRGARGRIALVNLDRRLIDRLSDSYDPEVERDDRWMAERDVKRSWLRKLDLDNHVVSLRSNHRLNVELYLTTRFNESMGFLHGPKKGSKVWWTPKVAIAVSQKTPVFVDWRDSRVLGKNWSMLAGTFETLTSSEQRLFAEAQYETYLNCIPNDGTTKNYLGDVLNLEVEDNV
jgi:hypothetical protein